MSSGGAIWRVAPETVIDHADKCVVARLRDTCSGGQSSAGSGSPATPTRDDRKSDASTSEPEAETDASGRETTARTAVESTATAESMLADGTLDDSPTRRRNKRKMTEPRRRATDFSIRSICSSSNSDVDEDREHDDADSSSSAAKIWKPGSVYDASTPTTTSTSAFNFYPLNIPLMHAFHPGIGAVAVPRYSAATTPARPASCESSAGSSGGDHDRSAAADDTSSSGGRPPSAAGTRPPPAASDRFPAPSPLPPAADRGRAGSPRKNYKNMTKQRRIEANARERTRVHTISAAFESLRRAVPSYSYNQRLSKLAILRIACSYILALARLADRDYSSASADLSSDKQLSFAECVDLCTQTIQSEGRAKRRH